MDNIHWARRRLGEEGIKYKAPQKVTIDYPILLRPQSYGIFGGEFARPSPNLSHDISTNFSNHRAETEQLVCANYCYNSLVENESSAYRVVCDGQRCTAIAGSQLSASTFVENTWFLLFEVDAAQPIKRIVAYIIDPCI